MVGGVLILGRVVLWLATVVDTVGPGAHGSVRRCGKAVAHTGPGLHGPWPFPIARVDVGFRSAPQGRVRSVPRSHPNSARRRWKPSPVLACAHGRFWRSLIDVRMKRADPPNAVQQSVSLHVAPCVEGRRGCPRAREGSTEACVLPGDEPCHGEEIGRAPARLDA